MSFAPLGSIIIADGNGRVTNLEVGTVDQVLMFDPNEPNKIKWSSMGASSSQKKYFKASATSRNSTKSSSYTAILSVTVLGETDGKISAIKVLSRQTGNASSHSVRIFDVTNATVIGENTFDNTSATINTITPLSNLPLAEAIFEIQIKKNSGNNNATAALYEASIEYS